MTQQAPLKVIKRSWYRGDKRVSAPYFGGRGKSKFRLVEETICTCVSISTARSKVESLQNKGSGAFSYYIQYPRIAVLLRNENAPAFEKKYGRIFREGFTRPVC